VQLADAIARHARIGEPLRLTLRQLGAGQLHIDAGSVVSVCENPTVLAHAAQVLGPASKPLVCTDGQPDSAVDELLALLVAGGASLRYHGDFDWGGLRIASTVIERHGAGPWRFGADDYCRALTVERPYTALGPRPAAATSDWAPELAEEMASRGFAIHEEQLLDVLLDDLRRS
jgi:uncharacterized protein (TIGR02679 family)